MKTQPQRVSFEENEQDFTVAVLACMGFSTACIAWNTGYTENQVNYRIAKAGLQWARYNYRNGTSRQSISNLKNILGMSQDEAEDLAGVLGATFDRKKTKGKKRQPKRK